MKNPELEKLQQQINTEFSVYQLKFDELRKAQRDYQDSINKQDELNTVMAYFNKMIDKKRKEVMDKVVSYVTLGLTVVFEDPSIKLVVKERLQKNQKFYSIGVEINGVLTEDWNNYSGGILNMTTFMLRVVLLAISSNRKFIICDEPFSGLSTKYRENLSHFLVRLAEELKIQFFFVSHQQEIDVAADALYEIKKVEGEVKILKI